MNNFQLYKTNIPLGGQIKWNLTLESARDEHGYGVLFINDFKLGPVSPYIPFSIIPNNNLLNYSHLENIKKYYNQLENQFYKSYPNPDISYNAPHIWPNVLKTEDGKLDINKKSLWKDLHDSTLEMGISRSSHSQTGKQFEFFCPVWLEHFDPKNDTLSFKFALRATTRRENEQETKQEIITKFLNIKPSILWDYHSRFVKYFNKYTEDAALQYDKMGKDLLSINIDKSIATISGIDVQNGTNVKSKQINSLVDDLCITERLLMDFDDILVQNFQHQHIIARQLINFNFIFDADEFIPPNILNMMYGSSFEMDVHVLINGQELPMKDFYTNYDFIPRKPIGFKAKNTKTERELNIFDIIRDDKNVDLICKNKSSQNIFHWSLADNYEYIFNLYSGFGGYSMDDSGNIQISPHLYQDSLDIWTEQYSATTGNIDWCHSIVMNNINDFIHFSKHLSEHANVNKIGGKWCANIRFTDSIEYPFPLVLLINNDPNNFEEGLYILSPEAVIVGMPGNAAYDNGLNGLGLVDFGGGPGSLKCIVCNKENLDKLTFANFKKNLLKFVEDFENNKDTDVSSSIDTYGTFKHGLGWLNDVHFIKWLQKIEEPKVINIPLLGYIIADGPVKEIKEVTHIKSSESIGKIFRYDGNLSPCFVDKNSDYVNFLYFKRGLFQDEIAKSPFAMYANSGFSPKYPDLDYYPYHNYAIQFKDRDVALLDINTKNVVNIEQFMPYEYKLFHASKVLLLHNNMSFELTIDPKQVDLHEEIKKELMRAYDISLDKTEYIYSLYEISTDWEYASLDNINSYTYRIKLKLK